MSREAFFAWAEAQDVPYEFDGSQPVAMIGGTLGHSLITLNIQVALSNRLQGSTCHPFGPTAGIRTTGDAVRYPDAVVTCSPFDPNTREVPAPVVVVEVLSPSSGRTDRIVKLLEYRAVSSIRRYVIVEYDSAALTLHRRAEAGADWIATALTAGETLKMPEIGIEIPVADLFVGLDLEPDPSCASDAR